MFNSNIRFMFPWRGYQQRVLDEIETHLDDNKLHIIAPPGSGKTVLGLEVVRRLNKPTLILSPTRTIRNQWIERFQTLFGGDGFEDYSFKLKSPSFLTSSTYQSIHSCYLKKKITGDEEIQVEAEDTDFDLMTALKGIEVIVLDEAHHLKTEWWKSLTSVIKKLGNPTIISLTATPPYDSSLNEWNRYIELCGPIDAEIAVPELVKEKDLCAHQDLIYISTPDDFEYESIHEFYSMAGELKKGILANEDFIGLIEQHPALLDPEAHAELIYDSIEYYSSMVIFLNHLGRANFSGLLDYIGLSRKQIPPLDDRWLEYLLSHALIRDEFLKGQPVITSLLSDFKKAGLVEKRRIILCKKESVSKMLVSSNSKFKSIANIVDHEYAASGSDLRMVVLTDYVRKEYLKTDSGINKFGVIPIFRFLLNTNHITAFDYSDRMAVLSGSITIIPEALKEEYQRLAEEYGDDKTEVQFKSIDGIPFCETVLTGNNKNLYVRIITELFSRGKINILIGTKSLLGEGWDCQETNALILATFVGSYMLSNQMRGRAIRALRNNSSKTANIWHLMCCDTKNPSNDSDYELLSKRFKCFIGPDLSEDVLVNGLDRLELYGSAFKPADIEQFNAIMVSLSEDREKLIEKWDKSIDRGTAPTLKREIKAPRGVIQRRFIFRNTLSLLAYNLILSMMAMNMEVLEMIFRRILRSRDMSLDRVMMVTGLVLAIGIISKLPKTIRLLILAVKHGPVTSSFKQMGTVIMESMKELDMLERPADVSVATDSPETGALSCTLKNGSSYEQSIFLSSIEEMLGQISNPRYIITRKGRFILKTTDFHNVPSCFAVNKERAEVFHKHWNRLMGKSQMYYTRSIEGRKILVHARSNALSSFFAEKTEIVDSWKS